MDTAQLLRLINIINMRMIYEQEALKTDDPEGTCAAHHRGAVNACGFILKEIQRLMNEKEQ